MFCNSKGNLDSRYNILAGFGDAVENIFESAFGEAADNLKYAKLGNALTVTQIANHVVQGEWSNVAQDVVTWGVGNGVYGLFLRAGIAATLAPASSVVIATAMSLTVTWALGEMIDTWYCDPASPYRPRQDESPTQYYKKEYYDPIILDLDGNGVGTVAKFGYRGDSIAIGWVAVNDEWWERVV